MGHSRLAAVANHDGRLPASGDRDTAIVADVGDPGFQAVKSGPTGDVVSVTIGVTGHDPQLLCLADPIRVFSRKNV